MNLSLKSFTQLVQDMGAALQGSASALIDISVGSVTRALLEANAAIALWMQWLILQVLQTARATTSTGSDLDSWMADFGLVRLPASASSGIVTFFRFATTLSASIPPGTMVKTGDGLLTFSVVASSSVSIWDATSNSYIIPAGVASAAIPVVCNQAGQVGNVVAGSISIIASSLPGIDQVSNPSSFTDGRDAETDQSFRSRFVLYLAGLSRATPIAIRSAIANVQQGLSIQILEGMTAGGHPSPGNFVVFVDDGSGYPSSALLGTVSTAIESVRPIGTSAAVLAPTVIPVAVSLTAGLSKSDVSYPAASGIIQDAIASYLGSLAIGQDVALSKIMQVAFNAIPSAATISNIALNGAATDIAVATGSVVKPGPISVTINGI